METMGRGLLDVDYLIVWSAPAKLPVVLRIRVNLSLAMRHREPTVEYQLFTFGNREKAPKNCSCSMSFSSSSSLAASI